MICRALKGHSGDFFSSITYLTTSVPQSKTDLYSSAVICSIVVTTVKSVHPQLWLLRHKSALLHLKEKK